MDATTDIIRIEEITIREAATGIRMPPTFYA
jgi:hypothetical protein